MMSLDFRKRTDKKIPKFLPLYFRVDVIVKLYIMLCDIYYFGDAYIDESLPINCHNFSFRLFGNERQGCG